MLIIIVTQTRVTMRYEFNEKYTDNHKCENTRLIFFSNVYTSQ